MRSQITILFLIPALWAKGQSDELIVGGLTGHLHLGHTVVAKETWYSLGRLYNVNPKTLAQYNHLTFAHSLDIGLELKIPLTPENFSQDGKKTASESLVPVYHIVQEKEWLYRISVNHNKVPIPVLEKWNHVTGDEVHSGLHLIVGFLKVKTALSALARKRMVPPNAIVTGRAAPGGDAEKGLGGEESAEKGEGSTEKESSERESLEKGGSEKGDGNAGKEDRSAALYRKTDSGGGVPAERMHPAVVPAAAAPVTAANTAAPHFAGGRFKADFSDDGHSVTGLAGVFKSMSGWRDGKYYALINNVPVGTIVRITDQSNGKAIYAKVLGQLPDMKESIGLTVRLSNAAAAELAEGEGKFGVTVSY